MTVFLLCILTNTELKTFVSWYWSHFMQPKLWKLMTNQMDNLKYITCEILVNTLILTLKIIKIAPHPKPKSSEVFLDED